MTEIDKMRKAVRTLVNLPRPVGEESPAPRTPGFSEEMQEALHADAAKLSALTGEEHTVTFLATPSSTTPNTQEIESELNEFDYLLRNNPDTEDTVAKWDDLAHVIRGAFKKLEEERDGWKSQYEEARRLENKWETECFDLNVQLSSLRADAKRLAYCIATARWPRKIVSGGYKGAYTEKWVMSGENFYPKGYEPNYETPRDAIDAAMGDVTNG